MKTAFAVSTFLCYAVFSVFFPENALPPLSAFSPYLPLTSRGDEIPQLRHLLPLPFSAQTENLKGCAASGPRHGQLPERIVPVSDAVSGADGSFQHTTLQNEEVTWAQKIHCFA